MLHLIHRKQLPFCITTSIDASKTNFDKVRVGNGRIGDRCELDVGMVLFFGRDVNPVAEVEEGVCVAD